MQVLLIVVLLLLALFLLPRLMSDKQLLHHFGTRPFRILTLSGLAVLIGLVTLLAWNSLTKHKDHLRADAADKLEIILKSTSERHERWRQEALRQLTERAHQQPLRELTEKLLHTPMVDLPATAPAARAALHNMFADFTHPADTLYILDPKGITLSAPQPLELGKTHPIKDHYPEIFNKVTLGNPQLSPPLYLHHSGHTPSDAAPADTRPYLFLMAPIMDHQGQTVALLTQQRDPAKEPSTQILGGTAGLTGESYLVDAQGRMVTTSRFAEQPQPAPPPSTREGGTHGFELRDPGGDLTNGYTVDKPYSQLPFTRMATHMRALAQSQGDAGSTKKPSEIFIDTEGYQNYRGKPVYGAWIWKPQFGMGIATEIERDEMLQDHETLSSNVMLIVESTLFITTFSTLMIILFGERLSISMRKTKGELEARVRERTEALQESQERQELALKGGELGFWDVNLDTGITVVNHRYTEIFGFSPDNLLISR
ncbi:hypothetical protein Mmc1_3163 [Magnetococcus marinus MC-1]|uniref:PAS domain-containing protein n=1 Tax=Magnetococcus marinus (strain ATCC BAA-1437 / JCM 17883 / MC-1) TaxID=156889 RepID=A0LCG0_MAGMM|nr:PAS domain-containing protein [Magnetococcus marinus]ABK45653.1 hypothetical protein Mmc1_3163 [Magnetococcus marinus MC-1]